MTTILRKLARARAAKQPATFGAALKRAATLALSRCIVVSGFFVSFTLTPALVQSLRLKGF